MIFLLTSYLSTLLHPPKVHSLSKLKPNQPGFCVACHTKIDAKRLFEFSDSPIYKDEIESIQEFSRQLVRGDLARFNKADPVLCPHCLGDSILQLPECLSWLAEDISSLCYNINDRRTRVSIKKQRDLLGDSRFERLWDKPSN